MVFKKKHASPKRRWTRRFRRHRKDSRIPILTTLGLVTGFISGPSGKTFADHLKRAADTGDFTEVRYAGSRLLQNYTGIDLTTTEGHFQWRPDQLMYGLVPLIAGSVGSSLATRFGANRVMKKIPIVGRYVKL